jgi:hypothetical protein
MISIYCNIENWQPCLDQVLKENASLDCLDVHLSINCLSVDKNKKYNFLILTESPAFLEAQNILQFVHSPECKQIYSKVYTSIDSLLNYSFVEQIHPSNTTWVKNPILLPPKNKLISMIASNNSFLPGHKMRLSIRDAVRSFVDVYGRGTREIETKDQGLVDYYYSIAVENSNTNSYFSEKILDCFMTCTIPVYWGSQAAYKTFNPKGIIDLNSFQDLNDIQKLDKQYYCDNIDAVVDNFFIAQKENRYLPHTFKIILTKLYNDEHNK